MFQNNFGLYLKSIRNKRHITQKDISEKLGISRSAYSSYEQGLRLPDVNTLAELSVILDTNLFSFFYDIAMSNHKPVR